MRTSIALVLAFTSCSSAVSAQTIPLHCKDFIALTETAVQQRDAKFSKAQSLQYLGGDEFMSNQDEKIVRQMIERVYKKTGENLAYHVNQTKKECSTKLTKPR
ncbi:MAG: hypothetical protein WA924_10650 [Burkholderiaceae bacterium]